MLALPSKVLFMAFVLTAIFNGAVGTNYLFNKDVQFSVAGNYSPVQNIAGDTTIDLYLLVGQSNMAGRGVISEAYKSEGNSSVLMLDKNNTWVQARHPLHFDKPSIAGVGPGLSFGLTLAKDSKTNIIGLIPCAMGGTSIDVWKPGAYDEATKTHPYDDAIKRLKAAMQYGQLKGIIWLQGEADSSPEKAAAYLPKLQQLIERFREVSGQPHVPFVAGELGRYKPQYQNINNELHKLPSLVSYTGVASSKGFTHKGDTIHFNAESAEKYGLRFAKAMKRLQKQAAKAK